MDGTVALAMALPWPPLGRRLLAESPAENGAIVSLSQLDDGCLELAYATGLADEEPTSSAVTCPIVCVDDNRVVFIATWKDDCINRIYADNYVVYSTDPGEPALVAFLIVAKPDAQLPTYDFTADNEKAVKARTRQLANRTRRQDRIHAGEEYAFSSLGVELAQLEHLVGQVGAGDLFHVPGIMARVRLLLINKSQPGLLQICASYLDMPLILYTNADPFTEPLGAYSQLSFNGSESPKLGLANPVDIDRWLDLPALTLASKKYPNRELIREIGNTVASHLDLDMAASVVFLKVGRTNAELHNDPFVRYCMMAAKIVRSLCRDVLAAKGA